MRAPVHPAEQKRALAVQALKLVGTPAEERFDKITRIAKRLFNVPFAAIDIVAERRVWLKSAQGTDQLEGSREESYCQHALWLGRGETCLIVDARKDPRTCDSPYAEQHVFYAGIPLHHESMPVGVLCITDSEPRFFSTEDMHNLRDLAELAERELSMASLSEEQHRLAAEADELERKALVDDLTRLWNRGAIMELAARELQAGLASRTPTAVLMLDVDHFKRVNDTHGHPAGDEVLRQVSSVVRASVRPSDAVGRYGGEEFLVVLPACPLGELYSVAERIRSEVSRYPITCAAQTALPITVSIGGTVSHDGAHFAEMLVKAADVALYKAKDQGRNRTVIEAMTPSRLMLSVRPPPKESP